MSDEPEHDQIEEREVLIIAPFGRDFDVLANVVEELSLTARRLENEEDLSFYFRPSTAAIIGTQEGLTQKFLKSMTRALETQPRWSEMPLIFIIDDTHNASAALNELQNKFPRSKVSLLLRPIRRLTLMTTLHTATVLRARQYDLWKYLQREKTLRHELNHRVKNIIASIQALCSLTERMTDDPKLFAKNFRERLSAMSRVHEALYRVHYRAPSLEDALRRVISPYNQSERRVILEGPRVQIKPDAVQNIGLLIHELATNACKYGALSNDEGTVTLSWLLPEKEQTKEEELLQVTWRERGGPAVKEPTRQGYGTVFLDTIMASYGGKVAKSYAKEGLEVTLSIPSLNVLVTDNDD